MAKHPHTTSSVSRALSILLHIFTSAPHPGSARAAFAGPGYRFTSPFPSLSSTFNGRCAFHPNRPRTPALRTGCQPKQPTLMVAPVVQLNVVSAARKDLPPLQSSQQTPANTSSNGPLVGREKHRCERSRDRAFKCTGLTPSTRGKPFESRIDRSPLFSNRAPGHPTPHALSSLPHLGVNLSSLAPQPWRTLMLLALRAVGVNELNYLPLPCSHNLSAPPPRPPTPQSESST